MLDMQTIHLIESIAIQLRVVFDLPIAYNSTFTPIGFDELKEKIMINFDNIEIKEKENSDRSYVIKIQDDSKNEKFLISIGKKMSLEKKIDCLIHEVAHVFMHKETIGTNTPLWKNGAPWEQEDEANCFVRSFLMPKELFIFALMKYSSNDGSVDIDGISEYFCVSNNLVIERGRDLFVWR